MSQKYKVIFYDEDREKILDEQEVDAGESVKYRGKLPEKSSENGIKYVFDTWETTGNIDNVTEDIRLYAKYTVDTMFALSQENAENSNLNEVMQAGQKVNSVEKATRNMSVEEKQNLVQEIMDKGYVSMDNDIERE